MAKININNGDANVTYTPNIAGSLSPLWAIKVPEKIVYTVMDNALLIMKLRNAAAAEVDPTTDVTIAGIRPGRRVPTEIDSKDYRPFSALALNEQYDNNKNGMVRLHIAKGRLDLLETHTLLIMVNCDEVIDDDESLFEIEIDEQPYRDR